MTETAIGSPLEMGNVAQLPGAMPNMPAVVRILSRYDRAKLEAFVAVAIDLLDTLDGDCDVEANGDEVDASWPNNHGYGYLGRPESPVMVEDSEESDTDTGIDDEPHDLEV